MRSRSGHNDCQIERITGIPRRTVLDWRAGRPPDFAAHLVVAKGDPAIEPQQRAAYSYLLGLYLGDGTSREYGRPTASG